MKNLKSISLFSCLLVGLLAFGIMGCEDVNNAVSDASEAVTEAGEAVADAAKGAKNAISDALKPGDEGFDPAIHHGMPEVDQSKVTHTMERSHNYLDFAHFGHYDLEHMKLEDSSEKTEGETVTKAEIYVDDVRRIEITESVRGKHGYTHVQVIKDNEGKVLKKRTFDFETDPSLKLVERIEDIESGHLWTREDDAKAHYSEVDAHPFSIHHDVKWKDTPIKG